MPFDTANLTALAARHQRLMQIRYGQESHGLTAEEKLQKILHCCAVELDVARAGLWRLDSVGDARSDHRTADLTETYLKPLGIYALLDCPLYPQTP
jgi:hypothetical protein